MERDREVKRLLSELVVLDRMFREMKHSAIRDAIESRRDRVLDQLHAFGVATAEAA